LKTILTAAVLAMTCVLPALAAEGQTAGAPATARVRGTITTFDGKVLVVHSREGKDMKLLMGDKATVGYPKTVALADLKPGEFVAVTSTRNGDGRLTAREVRLLPSALNPGHRLHDLEPGSTMTNASLAKTVKSTNAHELTVEYQGGSQTILVTDTTSVVTTMPGDRSLLVPGAYVYIIADVAPDGTLIAQRIQASKDGVRPGQ
jgi:hypothetical protein